MSRVKIETSDDFDIEFEDGDAIIVVQADGNVRKLYLPQMDSKYFNSEGYRKLLDCIDILQPGAKEEFIKFLESKNNKKIHFLLKNWLKVLQMPNI